MHKRKKLKISLNGGNYTQLVSSSEAESRLNSCKITNQQTLQAPVKSEEKHKSISEGNMESKAVSYIKNHIFKDKNQCSNLKYNLPSVTVTLTDFMKIQLKKNSSEVNIYQDENGNCYRINLDEYFDIKKNSSNAETKFKEINNVSLTLNEGNTNQKNTRNLKERNGNMKNKSLLSKKKQSSLKISNEKTNSKSNLNFLSSDLKKKNNANIDACGCEEKLEDFLEASTLKNLKERDVFDEFLNIFSELCYISNYTPKDKISLNVLKNKKNKIVQVQVKFKSLEKLYLSAVLNVILKNHKQPTLEIVNCLKEGLCFNFLENNYIGSKDQFCYQHKPSEWFFFKMKNYSCELIMSIVIVMRKDALFVDVVTAALKILSEKKNLLWTTVLVFFVYYVIDTSEEIFLAFWVNAARFFGNSENGCQITNGISCLLHIFRGGGGGDMKNIKIHKFIKLIKQIPLPLSYNLLQPVIKMNLPSQFLMEMVELSIKTKENALKIFEEVIPEICFETMSLDDVELLLKFCKMLETQFPKNSTYNLKQKLLTKVHKFSIAFPESKYPCIGSFLREVSDNAASTNFQNHNSIPQCFIEKTKKNGYCNIKNIENRIDLESQSSISKTETLQFNLNLTSELVENTIHFSNMESRFGKQAICTEIKRKILRFLKNCQFIPLNAYLNDLKPDILKPVAEFILASLLKMKISLENAIYLIKILLLYSDGEKSSYILASITITLIVNLVKIREWEKPYNMYCFCSKKQINLVHAMVLPLIGLPPISELRVALLLVEMCVYTKNYEKAMFLIRNYYLYSPNRTLCELTWKENDEKIRIQILEKVFEQTICNYAIEIAYDLFILIYTEQKQSQKPFDLRKFANEILTLILNQNSEEAIRIYNKIQSEVVLKDLTVRGFLITMVRHNRLQEAKDILMSLYQNVYFVPDVTLSPVVIMISNSWLEEEIYVIFDKVFDLLASNKRENHRVFQADNLNVYIKLSVGGNNSSNTFLRHYNTPFCLSLVKPDFRSVSRRIIRVLENKFTPSILLKYTSGTLELDGYTLCRHLLYRSQMIQHSEIY